MISERIYPLDQETLELFAMKGIQGDSSTPQTGNANALKVRRVMQLISDFSEKPFSQLKILDLACGEGVYAIEAALRGADVTAIDARAERMNEGAKAADRLSLNNLHFEQKDIRNVKVDLYGKVDVVLFLGILYHLDQNDMIPVMKNIYNLCDQFLIIDTHIALKNELVIQLDGNSYGGKLYREHSDNDPDIVRRSRLLASIDNPLSFWFTKDSLFRLLNAIGFTTICECIVPFEVGKPEDRITIIATKGKPVKLSSYPWVNDMTEEEIKHFLGNGYQPLHQQKSVGIKHSVKSLIKNFLSTSPSRFKHP